jgi:hypothetical protein
MAEKVKLLAVWALRVMVGGSRSQASICKEIFEICALRKSFETFIYKEWFI